MASIVGLIAAVLVALALAVAAAAAEEQTRDGYIAAVEPICKRDRGATERILAGTKDAIREGRLDSAGRRLIRASERFAKTISELRAVPRPPVDEAKLLRWFEFLGIVKERIRQTGIYYIRGERIRATHESIRVEKSGNAANNVSFSFGFKYCRLSRSRLG
jgi:hypothetical protein